MTEMMLIGIALAVAGWSILVVAVALYVDDAAKTSELAGLLVSLATLLADRGRRGAESAPSTQGSQRSIGPGFID